MLGIDNFLLFFISAVVFIITPGIDTIFVLNKSISQGKKAGIYSSLGISTGVLVHTLFAALGLSIILAQSAIAFSVIKYLGALYLIYLGVKAIFSKTDKINIEKIKKTTDSEWGNFKAGVVTNVLNPKVALFFLSFFPQFIRKEYIETPIPFIVLGMTYAILGLVWCIFLGFFSALFSSKLKESPKFNYWLNKVSGVVFILMGVKVALTKK